MDSKQSQLIRVSKHILKDADECKLQMLDRINVDFTELVSMYINMIIDGDLPLKKYLSSKELPVLNNIIYSVWKVKAYEQASQIVKSTKKKFLDQRYKKYKRLYAKCKEKNIHCKFTEKKYGELKINYDKYIKFCNVKITKPTILLSYMAYNIKNVSNYFDGFLQISTPYRNNYGKRYQKINLPVKNHKHSNKIIKQGFKLANTIGLEKINNNW